MKLANSRLWIAGLSAATICCSLHAADQPNEEAVKVFMRAKLEASQEILEGLATKDFDAIEVGADQLHVLSQRAAWNVLTTAEYVQHTAEFQRQAKQMSEAARNRNLDAAALAYVQMTLTCVNCHQHMRGVKVADLGPWHNAVASQTHLLLKPSPSPCNSH